MIRVSPEELCCVLEEDTLSSAWYRTGSNPLVSIWLKNIDGDISCNTNKLYLCIRGSLFLLWYQCSPVPCDCKTFVEFVVEQNVVLNRLLRLSSYLKFKKVQSYTLALKCHRHPGGIL